MATTKRLSLIYEIQNFADTYLRKVTKFQGNGLFRVGVLSHLLCLRLKTLPLPRANRVKLLREFILSDNCWNVFSVFDIFSVVCCCCCCSYLLVYRNIILKSKQYNTEHKILFFMKFKNWSLWNLFYPEVNFLAKHILT